MQSTQKQIDFLNKLYAPIFKISGVRCDFSRLNKSEASSLITDLRCTCSGVYEANLRIGDLSYIWEKAIVN